MEGGDRRIRSVAVVGGGIVAWSAAAFFKRRLPMLDVTILADKPPAGALADRIPATLPSIQSFHGDLGLRDEDAVLRTGASFRLGTLFAGWAQGRPDYVHSYGEHGPALGGAAFHHYWTRAAGMGSAAPFDRYSPAAALARSGRLAFGGDGDSPFARVPRGLELSIPIYVGMLTALARHLGVTVRDGSPAGVRLDGETGGISELSVVGGGTLVADLFVDAGGPAAPLRAAMPGVWEDWRAWLPCDRILLGRSSPPSEGADLPLLDRATAHDGGWHWRASGLGETSHGLCYAAGAITDTHAVRLLHSMGAREVDTAPLSLLAGTRTAPWRRNCVAIGDAATVVEPLEWTNLHLAQSAIDRIVSMMPDRHFAPVELAEYNRQSLAEAHRVRDFLALHYLTAQRDEPFWRAAASVAPPASLAHTLGLFRERGRLPFFEEETFSRDSWLAVLLGQGVVPRRIDPLADHVPAVEAQVAMTRHVRAIEASAALLPTHAACLGALQRQIAP